VSRRIHVRVPCTCSARGRLEADADANGRLPASLRCSACGTERPLSPDAAPAGGGLVACVVCGHPELFTRKRFPTATGFAIVIVAALYAPSTHYLSLGVAAVIDWLLYHALPDGVVCYVCGAEHRGFPSEPRHPRFDREIAERLRFGERAVMGRPMRKGGTAGAPDPEH